MVGQKTYQKYAEKPIVRLVWQFEMKASCEVSFYSIYSVMPTMISLEI